MIIAGQPLIFIDNSALCDKINKNGIYRGIIYEKNNIACAKRYFGGVNAVLWFGNCLCEY